jgi:YfiH family protein
MPTPGERVWSFPGLPPGLRAGFTTRRFAAGETSRRDEVRRLAAALDAPAAEAAVLSQVHGREVIVLDGEPESGNLVMAGEGDAAVTSERNRLLVIQSADCVPILLADPITGWIAAVHAGWRGTALRILDTVVDALEERGVRAENLFSAFGPAISRDSYEVGPDVVQRVTEAYDGVPVDTSASKKGRGDRTLLDVAAFNRALLLHRGIPSAQLFESGLCTFERSDLFPSYRRDGPGTGRILTGIVRL